MFKDPLQMTLLTYCLNVNLQNSSLTNNDYSKFNKSFKDHVLIIKMNRQVVQGESFFLMSSPQSLAVPLGPRSNKLLIML